MIMYIARRCLTAVIMMVLISILIFGVLRILPGDPVIAKLAGARGITPQAIAALRHQLGLDSSLPVQYVHWIGGAIHGDFGQSYFSQYSVTELIGQRIGATTELAVAGIIVAVILSLVLAISPVVLESKLLGRLVSGYTVLGLSAPPFLIGIGVLLLFGNALHWLPRATYVSFTVNPGQNLAELVAPAVTLGAAVSAPLINYLRASLRDVESAQYVRTAVGTGVGRRRVVLAHITPNAVLPALTALGVSVGALLGGVVAVEYVFGWPGLGSELVSAVQLRDYAVIQSMVLLAAAVFVVTALVVDILYGVLDPRLRVAPSKAVTA